MRFLLYSHGGSANHGCEALVRSTAKILRSQIPHNTEIALFSYGPAADKKYGVEKVFDKVVGLTYKRGDFKYYCLALLYKMGLKNVFVRYQHRKLFNSVRPGDICLSMGGDTYTYDGWPELLSFVHKQLVKRGAKTVLWGCSVSKELMQDKVFLDDAKTFDLITVREPISYRFFLDAGIKDNVVVVTDPAFELDVTAYDINQYFSNGCPVVGINLSPLVMSCENAENITLRNYQTLVQYILDNTDYNIALIPHVVVSSNDDRKAMAMLSSSFNTNRLASLPDMDCTSLKGAIKGCKFFIGARTHSTIAAYSQCIPTLVVGYSVKAKGIAEDIFGTYENYVLPVQNLKASDDLTHAFQWLEQHETDIRHRLEDCIPKYKKHCYDGVKRLQEVLCRL